MVCAGKGTKLCSHTFSGIYHKYPLFLKYKKTPPYLLRSYTELTARQAESFIVMFSFIPIYILTKTGTLHGKTVAACIRTTRTATTIFRHSEETGSV
jgi:hypothetical protein